MRRYLFALTALSFFLAPVIFAQQKIDADSTQVKIQKLSQHVYMLQIFGPNGAAIGGNLSAFVDDDVVVLTDCNFVELGPKIEAAVKTITDKPIKYVLNTHWHGDHTGGNAYFAKTAIVIGQENVREKMKAGAKLFPPSPAVALPVITYSDEFTLHMKGGDIHTIYFPHGHTNSDSVVFFPQDNVVQTGDDFTIWVPPHFPGFNRDEDGSGNVQGQIAVTEYVMAHVSQDVKIVPGHGNLGSKDDLAKQLAVLQDTVAAIQSGIDQGKSLEQLKQEKVLAKWTDLDSPGRRTDVYLELVYNDLIHKSRSETTSSSAK